jgi:hypothetical protein
MEVGFMRNQDSWQVIDREKCKKKAISYEKYRKTSFFGALRWRTTWCKFVVFLR